MRVPSSLSMSQGSLAMPLDSAYGVRPCRTSDHQGRPKSSPARPLPRLPCRRLLPSSGLLDWSCWDLGRLLGALLDGGLLRGGLLGRGLLRGGLLGRGLLRGGLLGRGLLRGGLL